MAKQKTQSPNTQLSPTHLDELKLLRDVIPHAKNLGVPNTNISLELLEVLLHSFDQKNS